MKTEKAIKQGKVTYQTLYEWLRFGLINFEDWRKYNKLLGDIK